MTSSRITVALIWSAIVLGVVAFILSPLFDWSRERAERAYDVTFSDLATGFLLALAAAVFTLAGQRLMLSFQTQAKVREELRDFIRAMHPETVAWVADLDLFVRQMRARTLVGPKPDELESTKAEISETWEGDLLRRTRLVRFGHPDPDVRRAAEVLEDEMWPFIVNAGKLDRDEAAIFASPPKKGERAAVLRAVDAALTEVRRTVYAAPRRDVPAGDVYDGTNLPSRLARRMAQEQNEERPVQD
ncbi:hypothetical protein [Crystallibacter degradans]|uniref:hypothetical protein n=1 Tax=Crystallibacter degradans TaxID=2726743 RepID=UPI001474C0F3|nr:hypothetical protein [Arthrobacter sp. SF27]NMR32097.1 hypothetical protein [Arthrobacter sp. SF27]